MEQLKEEGQENLRGDYHFSSSRKFEEGNRVRILDTGATRARYPKTVGKRGIVLFSYYTLNWDFKNYFIRVRLDSGQFASYFAGDLVKSK